MSNEKKNPVEQLKTDSEPAKKLENLPDDKKLSKDELEAVAGGGNNCDRESYYYPSDCVVKSYHADYCRRMAQRM